MQVHDGLSSGVRVSVAVLSSSFFDVDGFCSGDFGPRSSPFSFEGLLFDRDQQNERERERKSVAVPPLPVPSLLVATKISLDVA